MGCRSVRLTGICGGRIMGWQSLHALLIHNNMRILFQSNKATFQLSKIGPPNINITLVEEGEQYCDVFLSFGGYWKVMINQCYTQTNSKGYTKRKKPTYHIVFDISYKCHAYWFDLLYFLRFACCKAQIIIRFFDGGANREPQRNCVMSMD